MKRLVIISNRLPISINKMKGSLRFQPSVGGLATGVGSLIGKSYDGIWIGWPGIAHEKINMEEEIEINKHLNKYDYYPVYLTQYEVDNYYSGFSNRTIWPLFHYFTQHAVYQDGMWNAYVKVNRRFCDETLRLLEPDDIVWVHDYQLMLLPQMLREKHPDLTIGFFLHIPFPSFEVFRLLPWRKNILEGLLGSDLIGFHTYDYVRHFRSCVLNRLGHEHVLGFYTVGDRKVKVEMFPMGIDYNRYSHAADMPEVKKEIENYRKKIGNRKIILSVDRLDYTKGILERLYAFDLFLEKYPKYKDNVILILVAVPSRTKVENYKQLKKELDELIGRINGKHCTIGWSPVWYLYRSLPFHTLTALYSISDVALVTPLRDGMNLIAKEYIAAQKDGKGVLILSEIAGAAKELSEALIVNPNNLKRIADLLNTALTMSEEEQIERIRLMQNRLKRYNIQKWADDFIKNLIRVKDQNLNLHSKKITLPIKEKIISDYQKSKKRLFLLDYDGTLIPFTSKPQHAKPDNTVLTILRKLSEDRKNDVLIISGRDKATLEDWFKDLDIGLVAEHGVWSKEKNKTWELIETLTNYWKDDIRPLLENHMDRTPGSLIEEKEFSLVWHFRNSDQKLAAIRARELKESLFSLTSNIGLEILEGNKVVEIKNAGINKGSAAMKWINKYTYDFILSTGDDRTDEDVFKILPETTYSIKIGFAPSHAHYSLESVEEMRTFLKEMIGGKNGQINGLS